MARKCEAEKHLFVGNPRQGFSPPIDATVCGAPVNFDAELFNLLNRTNVRLPDSDIGVLAAQPARKV